MRKMILIATMSLLSTQAFAGGPRSLSLAATNASQPTTEQPAAAATPPASVQTATTTPASTPPATTAPAATPAQSTAAPVAGTTETPKSKHRQPSTEARVIRELHRHGIYW